MAVPAFVAAGPGDNIASASPTVTAPTGMVVGHYVILWFATDSTHTRTVPVGWNDLGVTDDAAADTTCSAIGKVATSGDVTAGNFVLTNYFGVTETGRAGSLCYSGTSGLHGVVATFAASTSASKLSPAITTTISDCLAVFLMGADPGADPRTCTATAPATARHTSQNALLGWVYAQDSVVAAPTVGFTQNATLSAIDGTGSIAFALAPASSGITFDKTGLVIVGP